MIIHLPKEINFQWDWQIKVVDDDGTTHGPYRANAVILNPSGITRYDPNEIAYESTVAREDIRQVILEGRSREQDYLSTVFKNVSLKPRK